MDLQSNSKILVYTNSRDKKTRKKLVTQWINYPLVGLNSKSKKYYQRAFYCASQLVQVGNSLNSKYCNSRTCVTCNGIRTASYIANYGSQILSLDNPQFITLTAPTVECVDHETLRHYIDGREHIWRSITDNARKRKIKLNGMKSMEITARPYDHFHIHFHLIVSGLDNAKWILKQWLQHYPNASNKAQKITPVTTEQGLLEVFKYGTKFLDKETVKINGELIKTYKKVNPKSTDLIITALMKKRLISTFGSVHKIEEKDINEIVESVESEDLSNYDVWEWINSNEDWYSTKSGEKFSNYSPTSNFRKVFFSG